MTADSEVEELQEYRQLNKLRKERNSRITTKPSLNLESSELIKINDASPEAKSPLKEVPPQK